MEPALRFCVLIAVIVAVHSVTWKDCGSLKGKVAKVSVTGCDSTPVCDLKHGQSYTISITFTPNEVIDSAVAVVHGILMGVHVPFPINNTNVCQDCGLTCPVASGKSVTYHSDIFVKEIYPKVKVVVNWELKDKDKNDIVCVLLPAQIVSGDKNPKNKVIDHNDTKLKFKSFS